ncbi:MAG: ATP synthase subunit I, partial [Acidimicrobiales bacterium]
ALAGAAAGGFAVRLAALVAAVALVKDLAWVELVPLGLTLVAAQVGLLWWEARHLSLSLAYPGLKPPPGRS